MRETDSQVYIRFSFRTDLRYWLWEAFVRLRHRFGIHTYIDIEDWSREYDIDVVTIIGRECWLCPARR